MKDKAKKGTQFSRRSILPILGSSLLIPFVGSSKSLLDESLATEEKEEYQTLLKPDGTTVKVKVSAIKKSKIVKKHVSNKSFLHWLGKKR